VTIQYAKLHADPKEGKSLDISKLATLLLVYCLFNNFPS